MKVDTQATSITPFAFGVGSIFVNLLNEHYWKLCFWVLPVFRKIATCLKEHTLCWWNGGKIVCVGIIVWKGVKTSKDGKFRQTKCIVRGQFKISHQIMASNMFQGRLKNVTLHLIYREDKFKTTLSNCKTLTTLTNLNLQICWKLFDTTIGKKIIHYSV